jgi:hypothetical protein
LDSSKGLAQEVSIIEISPPQSKNPGESITLLCKVSKPKGINVSWLKDSQMLTLGSIAVFYSPRIAIEADEAKNEYRLTVSLERVFGQTGGCSDVTNFHQSSISFPEFPSNQETSKNPLSNSISKQTNRTAAFPSQ